MEQVIVIGAGLAGCEAAWQLAERGIPVKLYEMRPVKSSPVHQTADFAELVCSNSLRANNVENAVGLLKEEMRRSRSLIMACADAHQVPAGGALAVDRYGFSGAVTQAVKSHPLITVLHQEVTSIPEEGQVIIAAGPLASDALTQDIQARFPGQDNLHFFDAVAPLVSFESINMDKAWFGSRYDKGTADYINCPMTREEYEAFWTELVSAQEAELHGFEDRSVFEGCMPVEVMARRGRDTLCYGPLKPVGLTNPHNPESRPYAVVQLRKDNAMGTVYNIVGFQTHLKWPEQKRVFSMIPGLEQAEFLRYGVMHRNTYLNSPRFLNRYYQVIDQPRLTFAGQITGVEGYVESAASGLVAGIELAHRLLGKDPVDFPQETALGALACYISDTTIYNFQPMNVNFGIIPPLGYKVRGKRNKNAVIAQRALEALDQLQF
ncbi:MAG: methylenetetrahydrofolate--tRNA-(uracil(54)-C(5))-methyltransferase (FADH(2)-oxidizing) TrmFO [Oscillospiraceae bacterium]|nr:methylenetetrahydrofolate--tRNA-(uracil(54)-C(5))-methyltransferase (FADH(2)-oxidizing) TrmFO [Oscillospiraceae bacterium]